MLPNLKIIYRFHVHPVHQNSVDILGPRYVGDHIFRVKASLVQSNFRSLRDLIVLESNYTEKDYFCCEEMTENNDKNI
jgi:hypothetical protein